MTGDILCRQFRRARSHPLKHPIFEMRVPKIQSTKFTKNQISLRKKVTDTVFTEDDFSQADTEEKPNTFLTVSSGKQAILVCVQIRLAKRLNMFSCRNVYEGDGCTLCVCGVEL